MATYVPEMSRDYDKLYDIVCAGGRALGFVDMNFREGGPAYRDAVSVRRFNDGMINIGVRGFGYGHVDKHDILTNGGERAAFNEECMRLNLEWADVFRVSDQSGGEAGPKDGTRDERGPNEERETPQ